MGRFSPVVIFRAHRKALSNYTQPGKPIPDLVTRAVLVIVPLAVGALCLFKSVVLASPDALLAAMALLSGGTLTAFIHLAEVRQQFTQREETWGDAERFARDSLDETAAHLLQASYFSIVAAVFLVIGMNVSSDDNGSITGILGAVSAALCSYVGLLFLLTLPRLYDTYVLTSKVRPEMSGTHVD